MVGSRPLTGDAVTVTVAPPGTHSVTACSVALAGITSYRGPDSSSRRLAITPPPLGRRAPVPAGTPRRRPASAAGRTYRPPAPPRLPAPAKAPAPARPVGCSDRS